MFTGIITDIGTVAAVEMRGDMRARIACNYDMAGVDMGASIACDGCCLTVVATGRQPDDPARSWFDVEISAETVAKTNIGRAAWAEGRRLNLERALKVGDELGGHVVLGHVDGTAEILEMRNEGDSTRFSFRAPRELAGFIASKGSVALNGTSLTVNEVQGRDFGVNLIPHTQKVTTWGNIRVGDLVNLEVDTMARYVARLQDWA